jgi:hypothetical protein
MRKLIAVLAVLTASAAFATTWTEIEDVKGIGRGVKGVFTSAAAAAKPAALTDGLNLVGCAGLHFMVETVTTAMPAGQKFAAYDLNPVTGNWVPIADGSMDWVTAAVTAQAWSDAKVYVDFSRITFEPALGTTITGSMYLWCTYEK